MRLVRPPSNQLLLNHHLIKNNQLHDAEKCNTKQLYSFSIFFKNIKPTLQKYFQNYLIGVQLVWSDIYSLLRIATIDSELRYFQYKILQNVLYLKRKIFFFGKTDTKLCYFCNLEDETTLYLFTNCTKANIVWANIKEFFNGNLKHPSLTSQSAMFGFSDVHQNIFLVLHHILLLFKHFIYISRDSNVFLFSRFFRNLQRVYTINQKNKLRE